MFTCCFLQINNYNYTCRHAFMYYLMLVRSALWDLWHEGCGRVADTARGEAECCIAPRDHNPSAINLITHSSPTLNGLLLLHGQHRAVGWLLTMSADGFCWYCTVNTTHTVYVLDYTIYGRGSAFDVAHEVTINFSTVLNKCQSKPTVCGVKWKSTHSKVIPYNALPL